jgi:hypothetical protein
VITSTVPLSRAIAVPPPVLPICDTPQVVAEELISEIRHLEMDMPRTKQTRIGPSEIGLPCERRLIRKLLSEGDPVQAERWLATIGTAVHAWLANGFGSTSPFRERYLIEQSVNVGTIGGIDITGSADLFDMAAGCVVDWKVVGNSRLDTYRRYGPGRQYRTQAHLYGRGFARMGFRVNSVLIMFLPRNKALSNAYPWFEPWDESVATVALQRAEGLLELGTTLPWVAIEEMFPPCSDEWCPFCPVRHPFGNRTPKPKTLQAAIAAGK